MGKKQYDGYEPFQYLDAGEDYETFATQNDPHYFGEPYRISLTDTDEVRAERLSADETIVSMHEHAFYFPLDVNEVEDYCRQGRSMTAYDALAKSNLDAVFDWHLNGVLRMHSKNGWKFSEVVDDLGYRAADIAQQEFVIRAESVEDIRRAHDEGKVAIVPAIESCMPIENELDRLDVLYGLGVRLMGITYVESNALGQGEGDMHPHDGGLTAFGEKAVERMNKLGMAVSLGHASDQTVLDVAEISEKPVFLSHNGARELMDSTRLNTDKGLKTVADTGGVIGINSAPHATATKEHPRHSIVSVMDHFEYIKNLVGIDHVTFGPDTLYGDHFAVHGRQIPYEVDFEIEQIEYVEGMENPTEAWLNIPRWLVKEGYSNDEIAKVCGENVLRTLNEVW